jgi:phenylalanyl-tRNA synthetase beta chain
MKFSMQWIQELVPGLDVPAAELEQLITVRTAESEGVERAGALLEGARVARVLSAEPVGKLTRALVDIGEGEPITVACGAPNCRAGMRTVWVPVGVKNVGGIESNGMLASAAELGLGREDKGIIEWSSDTIDFAPDSILEIDNKSLTHRPDLWGHLGMAREVAAITRENLKDPVDLALLPKGSDSFNVRVDDYVLCPRFSVVTFEDVRIAPSPLWLQYRLESLGLNPINNVVDITNFVMTELAQPMHAFDRDKLRGDRLIVRPAFEGEGLLALNGEEYVLSAADGVVADGERAVSLAGIIGGKGTSITEETTNIVFESANWNASQIRKTSARLKLRTDASMRFEKAQDPANTVRALARAIALMRVVCPEARIGGRLTDDYRALPEPQTIPLKLDVLDRKLGRIVPPDEVREILERLAFKVRDAGLHLFEVTVPTWRATKDIAEPDDLVEEVGRMIGYDTIPPEPPRVACTVPPDDPKRVWYREIRALAAARGYTEVYNYSFLSDEQFQRFALSPDDALRVLNPIASDQNLLRTSLIPGIFANLELNRKHFDAFRLFEIGREIHNLTPAMPREIPHLAAAVYAADGDGRSGLFELKLLLLAIAAEARVEPTAEVLPYEHPARTATIYIGDSVVGRLFEAHPSMIEGRAAILNLDLERTLDLRPQQQPFQPIPRFPSSAFDISVIAPLRDYSAALETRIREFAGSLLERIEFLREYSGPQVAEGMRSMTYRITVGSPERTLSSDEINAVRDRIIEGVRGLGHETRT